MQKSPIFIGRLQHLREVDAGVAHVGEVEAGDVQQLSTPFREFLLVLAQVLRPRLVRARVLAAELHDGKRR